MQPDASPRAVCLVPGQIGTYLKLIRSRFRLIRALTKFNYGQNPGLYGISFAIKDVECRWDPSSLLLYYSPA